MTQPPSHETIRVLDRCPDCGHGRSSYHRNDCMVYLLRVSPPLTLTQKVVTEADCTVRDKP
jgi:hypothetical protein